MPTRRAFRRSGQLLARVRDEASTGVTTPQMVGHRVSRSYLVDGCAPAPSFVQYLLLLGLSLSWNVTAIECM
jgi:hypothetical protein